jgi:hypothetical protein
MMAEKRRKFSILPCVALFSAKIVQVEGRTKINDVYFFMQRGSLSSDGIQR